MKGHLCWCPYTEEIPSNLGSLLLQSRVRAPRREGGSTRGKCIRRWGGCEVVGVTPSDDWLVDPQPQDLILTLLADNVRHRLDKVWSGGLVRLLEEFGFSVGAARVALSRLARRNLISRERVGRQVYYRLTDRTEETLRAGDERIFGFGSVPQPPDAVTILWHNLPDGYRLERSRLTRRLRFNGFGSPQDGTWLAMGRREELAVELVAELGIASFSTVLRCTPATGTELQALISSTWDLPGLDAQYRWFVDRFGRINPEALQDCEAFWARTQLIHNFRQFLTMDPEVDERLHLYDPARQQTIDLLHDLYEALRPAAHRYFDRAACDDHGPSID